MTSSSATGANLHDHFLGARLREGLGGRRALLTAAGALTYDDVHAMAGRYARLLLDEGVRPGDRVVIALPDGPAYVAALFGIARVGAVVVMVNPQLGVEQIRYFFDYTGARFALVDHGDCAAFHAAARTEGPDRELASSAAHGSIALVEVGAPDVEERLTALDPDVPTHPTSPDDPAIFLFSGGTTGHPKAVVQTHRSFANTTALYGHGVLGLGPDDVTLSVPKLYFGYATGTNLLFPFSVGATAALFPERCTTETLFAKIRDVRPTVLVNVPTMVNHMVSHPDAAAQDLSCLRLATSAGEALPAELHRRWDETFGVPLLDGLGTAEMWHIFVSNRPDDVRPGTLGKVVPGFELKVCDEHGEAVGVDEVGYLHVKGDSLALGYWQDDEKTALAFRDGWYVSNDMVRRDGEGWVTYCGRGDDMLKVSGKWLSPRELENCLLQHDAVREVAVVGARTPEGLVKPRAYVTLEADAERTDALAAALQQWAKERLEPYKYPREVVFRDDLPRTHLGKVDRGALAREEP